jgi:hypothetical protein
MALSPQYADESVLCWKAAKYQAHCREENFRASVAKGYSEGGVSLPLLWGLVVDGLLWELSNDGYDMVR